MRIRFQDRQGYVFRSLGRMLTAGIPLADVLKAVAEAEKKQGDNRWSGIIDKVSAGESLMDAMDASGFFPSAGDKRLLFLAEQYGCLGEAFVDLGEKYIKVREAVKKMWLQFTYPIFVLVSLVGVMLFFLLSVVPGFINVFQSSGIQPPASYTVLSAVSSFITDNWLLLLLLTAALCVAALLLGRKFRHFLKYRFPIIRDIYRMGEKRELYYSLKIFAARGVPPQEVIRVLADADPAGSSSGFQRLSALLKKGGTLSPAISESGFSDGVSELMVAAMEEQGDYAILDEVIEYIDSEEAFLIRKKLKMLQPILMLLVGFFVALVVASIVPGLMNYGGIK